MIEIFNFICFFFQSMCLSPLKKIKHYFAQFKSNQCLFAIYSCSYLFTIICIDLVGFQHGVSGSLENYGFVLSFEFLIAASILLGIHGCESRNRRLLFPLFAILCIMTVILIIAQFVVLCSIFVNIFDIISDFIIKYKQKTVVNNVVFPIISLLLRSLVITYPLFGIIHYSVVTRRLMNHLIKNPKRYDTFDPFSISEDGPDEIIDLNGSKQNVLFGKSFLSIIKEKMTKPKHGTASIKRTFEITPTFSDSRIIKPYA